MTDYSVPAIKVPVSVPGTAKPVRDPILAGLPDGAMRFIFDLDFSWCYPGGALAGRPAAGNPTNDQVIYDIAERADGSHVMNTVFSAPRTTYEGGGFDFTALTHTPFGVKGPADTWDTIFDGDQFALVAGYYRLPSSADFKPSAGLVNLFGTTPNSGTYVSNAEYVVIGMITEGGGPKVSFIRQTAIGGGTIQKILLAMDADYYGKVCQVAWWRTPNGVGCRVKSADAEVTGSAVVGSDNTDDPSGAGPVWGRAGGPNGNMSDEDDQATDYRVYRGFVLDLAEVEVSPLSIIDADWDRVQARIAASAASNGGSSAIFV